MTFRAATPLAVVCLLTVGCGHDTAAATDKAVDLAETVATEVHAALGITDTVEIVGTRTLECVDSMGRPNGKVNADHTSVHVSCLR